TGCVKFKQAWTVQPDGSGKMTMTLGFSEQMLAMSDEDPFADLDNPAEMLDEEDNGWVAFTQPKITTRDGFKFATFTGYFEDINQVSFSGDGGNGEMDATTYTLADGTLTVTNGMLGQAVASMAEDQQMQDPQTRAMMAPMLQGLEMTESYEVFGNVTDAEGFTADGRTAATTLTADDMLADTPPKIAGLDDGNLTIRFDPAGWADEAGWKKELADAKARWEQIKAEAAAEAITTE
ncbi:MAG: hypothetical protein AAF750_18170, partial [Planctomycetota bacterium]